jgi:hypothetical protein
MIAVAFVPISGNNSVTVEMEDWTKGKSSQCRYLERMTHDHHSTLSGEMPPLKPMPVRTKVEREWEAEQIRQSFVKRSRRAPNKTLRTTKLKPIEAKPPTP